MDHDIKMGGFELPIHTGNHTQKKKRKKNKKLSSHLLLDSLGALYIWGLFLTYFSALLSFYLFFFIIILNPWMLSFDIWYICFNETVLWSWMVDDLVLKVVCQWSLDWKVCCLRSSFAAVSIAWSSSDLHLSSSLSPFCFS